MAWLKQWERTLRGLVMRACNAWFAVAPRPVSLPAAPRVLIIRLDERLGNALLLTPMLAYLRQHLEQAHIDVVGHWCNQSMLRCHPAVRFFLPYRKWALCRQDGPLGTYWRMRQGHYDLCIDAANPTDPSLTQSLLCRFSGASSTIGSARSGCWRLYTAPVTIDCQAPSPHEIDLRLQLMRPLRLPPPETLLPSITLPALRRQSAVAQLLAAVDDPFAVLNVGARLSQKVLTVGDYVVLAQALQSQYRRVVVTYGPGEQRLARQVVADCGAILAPPTALDELAALLARAQRVISCDTGPMHLAVAVGAPTCGIFVATDPKRYGYSLPPHAAVRLQDDWRNAVQGWLAH